MGDMAEDFKVLKKHNKEIREGKEAQRMRYAIDAIYSKHYRIKVGSDKITVYIGVGTVTFFPYTGWFQGQKPLGKIKGRGIQKLLEELDDTN